MSGKVLVKEDYICTGQTISWPRKSSGMQVFWWANLSILSRAKFRVDHGLSGQTHGVAKSLRDDFLSGQSLGQAKSRPGKVLVGQSLDGTIS